MCADGYGANIGFEDEEFDLTDLWFYKLQYYKEEIICTMAGLLLLIFGFFCCAECILVCMGTCCSGLMTHTVPSVCTGA